MDIKLLCATDFLKLLMWLKCTWNNSTISMSGHLLIWGESIELDNFVQFHYLTETQCDRFSQNITIKERLMIRRSTNSLSFFFWTKKKAHTCAIISKNFPFLPYPVFIMLVDAATVILFSFTCQVFVVLPKNLLPYQLPRQSGFVRIWRRT